MFENLSTIGFSVWDRFRQTLRAAASYLFGDSLNIIRTKGNFIFDDLTRRALESQEGVSSAFIGPRFWALRNFMVFTGKEYIEGVVDYPNPNYPDPNARQPFDDLQEFLGNRFVINEPELSKAQGERHQLLRFMDRAAISFIGQRVFKKMYSTWSETVSINDKVAKACYQVISSALNNVEELPDEIVPIAEKGGRALFNRVKMGNAKFANIRSQFKAINDQVTMENLDRILDESNKDFNDNYPYQSVKDKPNSEQALKDGNYFMSLVVAGNLITVSTGLLIILAQAENGYLNRLKEELKECQFKDKLNARERMEELHRYPFLHKLYLEGLRYFAPAGPIARYASRPGEINGMAIPSRTYLFVPTRAILHDPKQWTDPERFNPDRPEFDRYKLNEYPFIPFSQGGRQCPASRGFAEVIIKGLLMALVDFDLRLVGKHQQLEVMPTFVKEPRLKKDYYATLQSSAESLNEETTPSPIRVQRDKVERARRGFRKSSASQSSAQN